MSKRVDAEKQKTNESKTRPLSIGELRKKEAYIMAKLFYDIYKRKRTDGTIDLKRRRRINSA